MFTLEELKDIRKKALEGESLEGKELTQENIFISHTNANIAFNAETLYTLLKPELT